MFPWKGKIRPWCWKKHQVVQRDLLKLFKSPVVEGQHNLWKGHLSLPKEIKNYQKKTQWCPKLMQWKIGTMVFLDELIAEITGSMCFYRRINPPSSQGKSWGFCVSCRLEGYIVRFQDLRWWIQRLLISIFSILSHLFNIRWRFPFWLLHGTWQCRVCINPYMVTVQSTFALV